MGKEEYLYMIFDSIENARKLREDCINQKEFYKRINGDKDIIRNLDNNILLANKTIESLENLVYLPVYEIIKNMSNKDLLNYKKNILLKEDDKIVKEHNIIEGLNEKIIEYKKYIESSSFKYAEYKKNKIMNDNGLDSYVSKCKEMSDKIKETNDKIKEHENNITNMMSKKNSIVLKTIEEFRTFLIDLYNINNIKDDLKKYKVNRSDEIIVNLCKDLNVLDEIQVLIKDYIFLKDKSIQNIIKVPEEFNEYKIKDTTNLRDFILSKCFNTNYQNRTNEIVIFDEKEIYTMKNNIDIAIKELNNNKHSLIDFKLVVNELSKLSFYTINKDLVDFVRELCNTLYLTDSEKNNVKSLYNKYMRLVNKKYKTEYSLNKSIIIEKELKYEIKNILDVYWGVLCERLESILIGIKSNYEFISNINSYNIHKGKDKMIFDVEHFSEMGLLNMRILIEKVLTKYVEINNELNKFNDDLSNYKNNLIVCKKNKEKELNNIKKRIDELYYKVSPNDFPILVSDYDNLNKIFKEKTLIDSIVKINRKNLISKVRSESVNYRDKENLLKEDIEVIKKKVLNK